MKSRLFYFLKSYFGFTRRESRGFILVVPSLILLYAAPSVYGLMIKKKSDKQFDLYMERVDSLIQAGFTPFDKKSPIQVHFGNLDSTKRKSSFQPVKKSELNTLDFNEADSIVLQIVPGIGATMAGRIIKFRDNIGGIYEKDQLLEVYGMTPEVLDRVFEYFVFKPGVIRKLSINDSDISALAKHPYISYGAAKVIVAYREQHGNYTKAEDLLKIKIFNQEWVSRLEPYLEF
ncbi:ComEA family DNA-binding protein [Shivajiella indica]|uniref:ComEA family DNA-binding protein n=1 Tax=Shivajiella indica TaxID=872115 RepID=A0ABW5BB81_9BACT